MPTSPDRAGTGASTGPPGGQRLNSDSTWNVTRTSRSVNSSGQCTLRVPGCSAAGRRIY